MSQHAFRPRRIAAAFSLILGLGLCAVADRAQADDLQIRWKQPGAGDVAGFRLHVGSRSRNYVRTIPLGKPSGQDGIYKATIDLGPDAVVYIALSSFNSDGWESDLSNEKRVAQAEEPVPAPEGDLSAPGKPVVIF